MKRIKKVTSIAVAAAIFSSPVIPAMQAKAAVNLTDINGSYAKDAIQELVEKGIINGYGDGKFNPTGSITRQEFAIILAKSLNLEVENAPTTPTFKDVPSNAYAFAYVEAAAKAGLIYGYSNGNFGANDNLTREQMAVLFVRSLGVDASGYGEKLTFKDKDQIADYAKDAVGFALESKLINGRANGTFQPTGKAERQAVALVASSFLKVKEEIQNPKPTPEPEPEPTPPPTPTPQPTPEPQPTPGPSLRTPPTLSSSVDEEQTVVSYGLDSRWASRITSITVKINEEEAQTVSLDSVNTETGQINLVTPGTGNTMVVTVKASGYRTAVLNVAGLNAAPELTATTSKFMDPISLSFTDDQDWREAITSIEYSIDGGSVQFYDLETDVTLSEGLLNVIEQSYNEVGAWSFVVRAEGYETANATVNIEEPLSTETGIAIQGFTEETTIDGITFTSEVEEALTVDALKALISSSDESEQSYEVYASDETLLAGDYVLEYDVAYKVIVTSEDGEHTQEYGVKISELVGMTDGFDVYLENVSFGTTGQTISLTEAVDSHSPIYRTFGNTQNRYMTSEPFKEATIGGSDYIVYVEFAGGETGFDEIGTFYGPEDGVTVTVKDSKTLTFKISSSYSELPLTFVQDHLIVVIENATDPSERYTIDLNVDANGLNEFMVNLPGV